jgi:hypothetical protein
MAKTVEGRSAGRRSRPSEAAYLDTISASENSTAPRIVHRLSHRFGVSIEVAGVLAAHAGLGPTEVRHG